MKIKYKAFNGNYRCESIPAYFDRTTQGFSERGVLEDVEAKARNIAEVLGKLCEILHSKGVLLDADLLSIIYSGAEIEIVEDKD